MIRSIIISSRLQSRVRLSAPYSTVITRGGSPHEQLSRILTASATLIKTRHGFPRCLSCIHRLSSNHDPTNLSSGEQCDRLKDDPEVKAWMSQIAQDFEKGREPFQVFETERQTSHTLLNNPAFDDRGAEMTNLGEAKYSADIDVEDFGYFEEEEEVSEDKPEKRMSIPLKRGQQGVFDVEEIVALLEDENGVDIQVIDIPPEVQFVDHMVVVSGKSLRHMRAMAASIEWLYRRKQRKGDRQFKLEGKDCEDWFAMDLGNIAVHIFMPETRKHYDIETLWTLGPEHDDQRHYVQDDTLNLSAADLFWLETGLNEPSSTETPKDANKTVESEKDWVTRCEQSSEDRSASILNDSVDHGDSKKVT